MFVSVSKTVSMRKKLFLQTAVRTKNPEITISVMQELIRRSAIRPALAARNDISLKTIIMFIKKYVLGQLFFYSHDKLSVETLLFGEIS